MFACLLTGDHVFHGRRFGEGSCVKHRGSPTSSIGRLKGRPVKRLPLLLSCCSLIEFSCSCDSLRMREEKVYLSMTYDISLQTPTDVIIANGRRSTVQSLFRASMPYNTFETGAVLARQGRCQIVFQAWIPFQRVFQGVPRYHANTTTAKDEYVIRLSSTNTTLRRHESSIT